MKRTFTVAAIIFVVSAVPVSFARAEPPWRSLPLATDGKVDAAWKQIGGGRFVVDHGTLRGESDETGMGMLLYWVQFDFTCKAGMSELRDEAADMEHRWYSSGLAA